MKTGIEIQKEIKSYMNQAIKKHIKLYKVLAGNILDQDQEIDNLSLKLITLISEISLCRKLLAYIEQDIIK